MYITKKIQQARNKTEKDEILKALKNSSIIHWSHISPNLSVYIFLSVKLCPAIDNIE
jgi:hypothetical protein